MGIGASVFLIAAGAILTFAVDWSVGGVDIDVVGWILMICGVIGLVVTLAIWGNHRRTVVADEPVEYRTVEERREVPPL